jgi:hypothetical protein
MHLARTLPFPIPLHSINVRIVEWVLPAPGAAGTPYTRTDDPAGGQEPNREFRAGVVTQAEQNKTSFETLSRRDDLFIGLIVFLGGMTSIGTELSLSRLIAPSLATPPSSGPTLSA